ncbi:MAG: hypothetical protein ACLQU1_39325, partial [Bryobacteraceae bacterium]
VPRRCVTVGQALSPANRFFYSFSGSGLRAHGIWAAPMGGGHLRYGLLSHAFGQRRLEDEHAGYG